MAGVDAFTLKPLGGFDHVIQSIEKIFTTGLGERTMREWVGTPATRLLGENVTERTILIWWSIVWMGLELFEPRFRVRQFEVKETNADGSVVFVMSGDYRPYAHLDWVQAQVYISFDENGLSVRPAS